MPLGENIRALHEAREWSQTYLGKLSGIGQGKISYIESGLGKRGPGYKTLAKIARALEVSVDTLTDGEEIDAIVDAIKALDKRLSAVEVDVAELRRSHNGSG